MTPSSSNYPEHQIHHRATAPIISSSSPSAKPRPNLPSFFRNSSKRLNLGVDDEEQNEAQEREDEDGMRTPTKLNSSLQPRGVPLSNPSGLKPLSNNRPALPGRSSDSYLSNHPHPPLSSNVSPNQPIPIPSAIPPIKSQQDSTPLPTLPIVVLCFAMISEFLSASVSGPFIFFMIEDFGVGQGDGNEAAVGFWAGIVSSVFFLSQFLTSLLWSNVSNKHGRRVVLFSSLLGNAITLLLFGSSTTLGMAICARLGQGVFNGAIGVARGAVRDLTDSSNEGRAIAWIGLCWGMGGIAGPIIGGLLEHPAENYPGLFGRFQFLKDYPYFLPCFVASCITFTGAMLSLFLGWDGGYRSGTIRLSESHAKIELPNSAMTLVDEAAVPSSSAGETGNGNLLSPRDPNTLRHSLAISRTSTTNQEPFGGRSSTPAPRSERLSTFTPGSAYGYSRRPMAFRGPRGMGSIRSISNTLDRRASRAISLARSFGGETRYAPDYDELNIQSPPTLNFAQRLLLANEDAVFGLHDVWLAAATTQDRDDEYSQMDADEQAEWTDSVFDEDDEASGIDDDGFGYDDAASDIGSFAHRGRAFIQQQLSQKPNPRLQSQSSIRQSESGRRPDSMVRQRLNPRLISPRPSVSNSMGLQNASYSHASNLANRYQKNMRSISIASSMRPAVFGNTGLSTPPSMAGGPLSRYDSYPHPQSPITTDEATNNAAPLPDSLTSNNNLSIIPENGKHSGRFNHDGVGTSEYGGTKESELPPPTNIFNQLPLAIIGQYAFLALHGTTCDQVFMSFLVTPIKSGGLGLSAGHFAELIAAMCIAQIVFQFRFYPTVGPPRGQFSHLSMLRLGLSLYIPVYMMLPELRGLLREEDQNGLVMIGMILLSTFRWLANVCAYTSVMVMINAQTPPHLIPLANGLAQSAVSAARFVGPVFGGMIWSFSITPSVEARPYPFNNALGFLVISVICLTGLLFSFRLR